MKHVGIILLLLLSSVFLTSTPFIVAVISSTTSTFTTYTTVIPSTITAIFSSSVTLFTSTTESFTLNTTTILIAHTNGTQTLTIPYATTYTTNNTFVHVNATVIADVTSISNSTVTSVTTTTTSNMSLTTSTSTFTSPTIVTTTNDPYGLQAATPIFALLAIFAGVGACVSIWVKHFPRSPPVVMGAGQTSILPSYTNPSLMVPPSGLNSLPPEFPPPAPPAVDRGPEASSPKAESGNEVTDGQIKELALMIHGAKQQLTKLVAEKYEGWQKDVAGLNARMAAIGSVMQLVEGRMPPDEEAKLRKEYDQITKEIEAKTHESKVSSQKRNRKPPMKSQANESNDEEEQSPQ